METFLYEDITREIIGAAFAVYKEFGYGFLEKVYENALTIELKLRELKVESQKPITIYYKGETAGNYSADMLVEEKVLVELKTEKEYNPRHEAQLIHYLKATNLKVGLLINFGEATCKPKRIIY